MNDYLLISKLVDSVQSFSDKMKVIKFLRALDDELLLRLCHDRKLDDYNHFSKESMIEVLTVYMSQRVVSYAEKHYFKNGMFVGDGSHPPIPLPKVTGEAAKALNKAFKGK